MNKFAGALGFILILIAGFLFFADLNGGLIAGLAIANFAALLFAVIFLPVGSGLAFFGFSWKAPVYAASGAPSGGYASSGFGKAVMAVAIAAIIIAAITLGAVVSVSAQKAPAPAAVTVTRTVGAAGVNATPTRDFYRIDWCNTDNTGQDRFCPSQIVVNQGDTVVILFEHNDTDAHTFTITSGYSFQINDTFGLSGYTTISSTRLANGMHNFVTNTNFTGSCTNVGSSSFSQQTAGVSSSLCVSGSSLLAGSKVGTVGFVNPTPGLPLNPSAPNGGLFALNDTNSVVFLEPGGNMSIAYANGSGLACTASACTNGETGAPSSGETWGIAAFQVTSPGTFEFFCHYHVSNGMFGYITVLPNAYCTSNPSACGVSATTNSTTT